MGSSLLLLLWMAKRREETLMVGRRVHGVECGNGFTDVFLCQNPSSIHHNYVRFLMHNYTSIKLYIKRVLGHNPLNKIGNL